MEQKFKYVYGLQSALSSVLIARTKDTSTVIHFGHESVSSLSRKSTCVIVVISMLI
mgnify:CR=1 FL=1